jgi:hypothetical protein
MGSDAVSVVSALIEAANVDTMYRDVYLGRARELLSPVVSLDAFHRMEQQRSALAALPLAVARAMERANWPEVKELSLRTDALKQELSKSLLSRDVLMATSSGPSTGDYGFRRSPAAT